MVSPSDWFSGDRPTRAINIASPLLEVQALCARKRATISAIERLPCGGTHVVLVTLDEADTIRAACKDKLLPRNTPRVALRNRANDY